MIHYGTMPQIKSAYKEMRKSKRKAKRNTDVVSELKTLTKRFNLLLSEKKFDDAKALMKNVTSRFHKAANKGIIRKTTVSRKLSRLSRKLHKASHTT